MPKVGCVFWADFLATQNLRLRMKTLILYGECIKFTLVSFQVSCQMGFGKKDQKGSSLMSVGFYVCGFGFSLTF